jgi:murein DD-endopeptidase MepM/ murein hydrolase activator NlpD
MIYFVPSVTVEATPENASSSDNKCIKWVNCNLTLSVMEKVAKLDIDSHNKNEDITFNWIELIAYLACKNGNNFKNFKQKDLDTIVSRIKNGEKMKDITLDMKYYSYYYESYYAILKEFIGEYEIETIQESGEKTFTKKYGIKAFLPIAKGYSFSHYDDFGNSRSYGFKRVHLGNDLMGSIGTPIIAVESGVIEAIGWNQYGGWRIGIRSFDSKRYYYYAHLRKNHPYAEDMYEGKIVKAGDVIGYLGMTGYSSNENVNNINVPHLHFGMQLIFDECQKDGVNQIWIDVYVLINFLKKNRSEVYYAHPDTKDYHRTYDFMENSVID